MSSSCLVISQAEVNHALADLQYLPNIDALGQDTIVVTASDGNLEGNASTTVGLVWPRGAETRPPTLDFGSPVLAMPEDGSMSLAPVMVRFGDGQSLVTGRVTCSVGSFSFADEVKQGEGDVVVVEGSVGTERLVVRGLPIDVARAFSEASFAPPKDWSSMAEGVVTLTMDIEAEATEEVRRFPASSHRAKAPAVFLVRFLRWVVPRAGSHSEYSL